MLRGTLIGAFGRVALIAAVVGAVAAASPSWCSQIAPPLQRAKALLSDMESTPPNNPDSLWKAIESTDLDLLGYLRSNPIDTEAALLLMRIHDGRMVLTAYMNLWAGELETSEQPEPYAAIVEQALGTDTLNAELHYWKSRLCWVPKPIAGRLAGITKLEEAVQEARRAVELDSAESRFRENLAFLLVVSGDESSARTMYKKLGADHPMYLLLHDWERMPAIEGTVPQIDSSRYVVPLSSPIAYAAAGMSRSCLFRGTAAEFEKRCRNHWPSFRLLLDPDKSRHPEGTRRYAQHLRWNGDILEPDAVQSDVSGGSEPGIGGGGIRVEVLESRALASDPSNWHPGVKPGEIFCWVEWHNKR